MTLEEAEANVGRAVVYQQNYPGAPREDGVIKEVRHPYVMVLYRGDYDAKATVPEDLEFLTTW